MGDRCNVNLVISGKLKRESIPDLLAVLGNHYFRLENETELLPDGSNLDELLMAYEVNYADIEDVEAVLIELGLDYEKYNDAGDGYSAATKRKIGDRCEQADGETPSLPYARILEIETLASGMGNLIQEARFWATPLAPLEIV